MVSDTPPNEINELGFAVGFEVKNWTGARSPDKTVLEGAYCRCEPLDFHRHSEQLFDAFKADVEGRVWVYLPYGPFAALADYQAWLKRDCFNGDPFFYAIVDRAVNRAVGVASYLRINPAAGSIEIGHINYSPLLQNTRAATEAMYLLMKNAFDMGYRRYEWKCNALNEKSCSAAKRLGFRYEGTFRQMLVVKGRNRDSAWFSVLDREWPSLCAAYKTWLDGGNFDERGIQIKALSELTENAPGSFIGTGSAGGTRI